MTLIYQCKNCGAVLEKYSLVCWHCNIFLDKNGVAKGKIKNSRALLLTKNSILYSKNEKLEKVKFLNEGKEGFVYLLKGKNYYKIGKTKSLAKRTKTLKIQLPFQCQLVHAIKSNNIDSLEYFWHKRFEDKRKNGEWFCLEKDDINEFIKNDSQIFE